MRPALVLFELADDLILGRITSALRSGPLDFSLNDWQQAGLLKPSIVRIDRIVTAERSVVLKRLGRLTARDLGAVRELWNRSMRL